MPDTSESIDAVGGGYCKGHGPPPTESTQCRSREAVLLLQEAKKVFACVILRQQAVRSYKAYSSICRPSNHDP